MINPLPERFPEIEPICPGYSLVPIQDLRGYQRCVDLQVQVWDYDDLTDVVPLALLAITHLNGGILLGARDGRGHLIGFVYSLLGRHAGRWVQHSHMLGVLPAHRGRHVGLALKLAQRECALRMGVRRIVWTFDPLQSLNAHFNFNHLGVWTDTYEVNAYGRSSSVLHQGLDTDRFLVVWDLASPPVRRRVQDALRGLPPRPAFLGNAPRQPGARKPGPMPQLLFEIPDDIGRFKKVDIQGARKLQRRLRKVCLTSFGAGLAVTGFLPASADVNRRCFYLFSKR